MENIIVPGSLYDIRTLTNILQFKLHMVKDRGDFKNRNSADNGEISNIKGLCRRIVKQLLPKAAECGWEPGKVVFLPFIPFTHLFFSSSYGQVN